MQNIYKIIITILVLYFLSACKLEKKTVIQKQAATNFIPFRKAKLWGLAEAETAKIVVEPTYDYVDLGYYETEKPLFAVFHKGKWGVIDAQTGKEILPIRFWHTEVLPNCILVHDTEKDKMSLYNHEGKQLLPPEFDRINHLDVFSEHKKHLLFVGKDEKVGIYNLKAQKMVVEPLYEFTNYANSNRDANFFTLSQNGKLALFDNEGKQITPFMYTEVGGGTIRSAGYAKVQNEKSLWGVVDKNGKEVVPCTYQELGLSVQDEMIAFREENRWGYVDVKKNKKIVEAIYDRADNFSDGFGKVEKNKKVGFVDKNGRIVVPPKYESALNTNRAIVFLMEKNTWKPYSLRENKFISEKNYTGGNYDFSYPYAVVTCPHENKLLQGVLDTLGKEIIACQPAEFGFVLYQNLAVLQITEQKYKIFALPSGKELRAVEGLVKVEDNIILISEKGEHSLIDFEGNILQKITDKNIQSVWVQRKLFGFSAEIEDPMMEVPPLDATGEALAAPPLSERYIPRMDKFIGFINKNGLKFWKD
ncbi:MAG: WG repeat-containing protein [Thermonemataceae bacterium]|nr:WG repeat-containing protein [Thermonemataceae bacterium]